MLGFLFVLCILLVRINAIQTTNYTTARDYRAITSENYPDGYPGPETWSWHWSALQGQWAVLFTDFDLSCDHTDILTISDANRSLKFVCGNKPQINYPYFISSPKFKMHLNAKGNGHSRTRGFQCQVLYASSRDELQFKIDTERAVSGKGDTANEVANNDQGMSDVVIILILTIVIVVVAATVLAVLLLRRRHHRQTTNSPVRLEIGAIRRDSSVSYTRNGNGAVPGGPRSRLDSDGSLSGDLSGTRPKRPVKRSESNASWAMRAEMNTSARNGSCSSEGHQHSDNAKVHNVYTIFPVPETSSMPDQDFLPRKAESLASAACRLSTISEEVMGMSKLAVSFPVVPVAVQTEESDLSLDSSGYMLMSSCSTTYVNYGKV